MKARVIPGGIDVYDTMPDGWAVLEGAGCAPRGYEFIWNRKSRFGGEFRHGLLRTDFQWDGDREYPQNETERKE